MTDTQRADLVSKIAQATSHAQQREAVLALDAYDQQALQREATRRELDLANAVVGETRRTVVTANARGTMDSDWLTEFDPGIDLRQAQASLIAQAGQWFERTAAEVKADRAEFGEQAEGFVRRHASAYGEHADALAAETLTYVGFLYRQAASGLPQIQQTVDSHDNPAPTPLPQDVFDNFAPPVDPINEGVVGTETSMRAPQMQEAQQNAGAQGAPEQPSEHTTGTDYSNSYSEIPPGGEMNAASGPTLPMEDDDTDDSGWAKEATLFDSFRPDDGLTEPIYQTTAAIGYAETLQDVWARMDKQAASGLDEIQQVVDPEENPKPTPLPTEVAFPWLVGPNNSNVGDDEESWEQKQASQYDEDRAGSGSGDEREVTHWVQHGPDGAIIGSHDPESINEALANHPDVMQQVSHGRIEVNSGNGKTYTLHGVHAPNGLLGGVQYIHPEARQAKTAATDHSDLFLNGYHEGHQDVRRQQARERMHGATYRYPVANPYEYGSESHAGWRRGAGEARNGDQPMLPRPSWENEDHFEFHDDDDPSLLGPLGRQAAIDPGDEPQYAQASGHDTSKCVNCGQPISADGDEGYTHDNGSYYCHAQSKAAVRKQAACNEMSLKSGDRCVLPIGHDGSHATRGDHEEWDDPKTGARKQAEYQYVKQQGDQWVVTQKGTGKVLSHHDSKEEAEASFRAMMSNKHGSMGKQADWSCPNCGSGRYSQTVASAGAGSGPGGRFRMGDPSVEVRDCHDCGKRTVLPARKQGSLTRQADQWNAQEETGQHLVQPQVANSADTASMPPNSGSYAQGVADAHNPAQRADYLDNSSAVPSEIKDYSQGYSDGSQGDPGTPLGAPEPFSMTDATGDQPVMDATVRGKVSAKFTDPATAGHPDFRKGYRFASKWAPGGQLVAQGSPEFEAGLYAAVVDRPDIRDAWRAAHRRQAAKGLQVLAQRIEDNDAYTDYLSVTAGIDVTAASPAEAYTRDTMKRIQERDPDGWETKTPNQQDYDAHHNWAVKTYGPRAWKHYVSGNWDQGDSDHYAAKKTASFWNDEDAKAQAIAENDPNLDGKIDPAEFDLHRQNSIGEYGDRAWERYENQAREEGHPHWSKQGSRKQAGTNAWLDSTDGESSPSPTGQTPFNGPGTTPLLEGQGPVNAPGGASPYNGAPPYGKGVVPTTMPVVSPNAPSIEDIPGGPVDRNLNLDSTEKLSIFRRQVQASLLANNLKGSRA